MVGRFVGNLQKQSREYDIPYGNASEQKYDVYHPANPNGIIIFMVHGGGWRNGDKRYPNVVTNKVAYYVPKGYTFVSINYRLNVDPYTQARDVAKALADVQRKASSWGCSPMKVGLMGHSAGAHLVSLLNADDSLRRDARAVRWLWTVSLDSAAYNVVDIMNHPHPGLYDQAFGNKPAYWLQCSPMQQLNSKPAPFLLVYSLQRGEGDMDHALEFADKITQVGGIVQVAPVDMSHGELNDKLGSDPIYTKTVTDFIENYSVADAGGYRAS